jgi:hypothetical protein
MLVPSSSFGDEEVLGRLPLSEQTPVTIQPLITTWLRPDCKKRVGVLLPLLVDVMQRFPLPGYDSVDVEITSDNDVSRVTRGHFNE